MKVSGRRSKRQLCLDYEPATEDMHDLGDPVHEPIWLEPYPESMLGWTEGATDPAAHYEARESVDWHSSLPCNTCPPPNGQS